MEPRDDELIQAVARERTRSRRQWDLANAAKLGVIIGLVYALVYAVAEPGFDLEGLLGKAGRLFGSLVVGGIAFSVAASIRNFFVR